MIAGLVWKLKKRYWLYLRAPRSTRKITVKEMISCWRRVCIKDWYRPSPIGNLRACGLFIDRDIGVRYVSTFSSLFFEKEVTAAHVHPQQLNSLRQIVVTESTAPSFSQFVREIAGSHNSSELSSG